MKGHFLLQASTFAALAIASVSGASAQVSEQTSPPTPVTAGDADTSGIVAPASAPIPGDQSAAPDDTAAGADIVVTGTLLRGIAPVGTNVIGLNRDQIAATGAVSTQQLLATVPQLTSLFNSVPTVGSGGSGLTIVRPNIRNLALNGGNTTLVLFDGHNVVGAGILQTTPDIGVIPPGAIERIDVVPDGGSSLYGSDAVGGIVNLITRKKFEGVELSGHLGTAEPYLAGDLNVTAGKSWSSGSALISYAYRANTGLLGRERDYFRQNLAPFGGTDSRVTTCSPGTITVGATNYAVPGRAPNTTNLCDLDLDRDIFPAERQHSVFGSLTQKIGDATTFSLTTLYTDRKTTAIQAARGTSGVIVTAANPYYQSITGEPAQSVAFNYVNAPGFGPPHSVTQIELFQITPTIEHEFNDNWKVTALGNFGRSVTTGHTPAINPTAESAALAGTTTATALNPYAPETSNASVLTGILNYEQYGRTRQTLGEGRLVVDGTLAMLPGGDVRVAVGGQYQFSQAKLVQADAMIGDLTQASRATANRHVTSVFGELLVPIFGEGNATPGLQSLVLDGSLRYDHYDDFGDTTNPKIGVTWKPFRGLTVRGNYGTSFNAPSLADGAGAVDSRVQVLNISPFQPNFNFADFFRPTILLAGGNTQLKPQTADTYSIGADFKPSFIPGLTLSATYWNVSLKNVIQVTPFYVPSFFSNPASTAYYVLNPTLAQAQALTAGMRIQGPSIESLYANNNPPYAIFNGRRNNLGTLKTDGVDFNAVLNTDTTFGAVSASFGGTVTLSRKSTVIGSAPFDELENGISPWQFVASLGDRIGNFTARATVNYSAGYSLINTANQTRVKSFAPTNLFFAYDLPGSGSFRGASLTLNIDNVFNIDPPFYNGTGFGVLDGTANGQTYGRLVNLGMRLKF